MPESPLPYSPAARALQLRWFDSASFGLAQDRHHRSAPSLALLDKLGATAGQAGQADRPPYPVRSLCLHARIPRRLAEPLQQLVDLFLHFEYAPLAGSSSSKVFRGPRRHAKRLVNLPPSITTVLRRRSLIPVPTPPAIKTAARFRVRQPQSPLQNHILLRQAINPQDRT